MKCETVTIKRRKICFGDLNRKITLQVRTLTPPGDPTDFDYGQIFTSPVVVWAAIQTTTGKDIFDGSNMIGTATHIFYIKFISALTSESMIEWKSEKYRILRIENLDENDEYMALFCNLRGPSGNTVNTQ